MSTEPLYGPPKVGGDVLAWCTKCKMELAHVVVSMIKDRPAKVICKTCKSQHNFKLQAGVKTLSFTAAIAKAKKTPAARSLMKVSELWEKKMAENKAAAVRDYSVQEKYLLGEVISHPKFGMGLIEEVKGNGKITVLFREDQKILVHGMQKP